MTATQTYTNTHSYQVPTLKTVNNHTSYLQANKTPTSNARSGFLVAHEPRTCEKVAHDWMRRMTTQPISCHIKQP